MASDGSGSVSPYDDTYYVDEEENEQSWPYPPEEDLSWYRTHASIRIDMEEFSRAIAALLWRTEKIRALEEWEKANLSMWWKRFIRTLQAHHSYEEEFLFPWLTTRAGASFPNEILAGDHDVITVALEHVSRAMTAVMWSQSQHDALAALEKLKHHFKGLRKVCLQHFEEEEKVCVPVMRRNFSHMEASLMLQETMPRSLTPEDMSQILRPMNKEERKYFMRKDGIGSLKNRFLLSPAGKKYDKLYTAALQEIIAGKRNKKQGNNWFSRVLGSVMGSSPAAGTTCGQTEDITSTCDTTRGADLKHPTGSYRTFTGNGAYSGCSGTSERSSMDGRDSMDTSRRGSVDVGLAEPVVMKRRATSGFYSVDNADEGTCCPAAEMTQKVASITAKLAAVRSDSPDALRVPPLS